MRWLGGAEYEIEREGKKLNFRLQDVVQPLVDVYFFFVFVLSFVCGVNTCHFISTLYCLNNVPYVFGRTFEIFWFVHVYMHVFV